VRYVSLRPEQSETGQEIEKMLRRYMIPISAANAVAVVLAGNHLIDLNEKILEKQKEQERTNQSEIESSSNGDKLLNTATDNVKLNSVKAFAISPDPDCEEVVCGSKKEKLKGMFGNINKTKKKGVRSAFSPEECPLDRAELGRAVWKMLHTTAAYYPQAPTENEKQAATNLIEAIAVLYPCLHCREHFAHRVNESPPKVSSRRELSIWLCETHNIVNDVLGKPHFKCSFQELDKRWRKGDKRCWSDNTISTDADEKETAEESLGH